MIDKKLWRHDKQKHERFKTITLDNVQSVVEWFEMIEFLIRSLLRRLCDNSAVWKYERKGGGGSDPDRNIFWLFPARVASRLGNISLRCIVVNRWKMGGCIIHKQQGCHWSWLPCTVTAGLAPKNVGRDFFSLIGITVVSSANVEQQRISIRRIALSCAAAAFRTYAPGCYSQLHRRIMIPRSKKSANTNPRF